MSLKVKVIVWGIVALIILLGVAYVSNLWGQRGLNKAKEALKAAQGQVDALNGQVTSLNSVWEKKEEEYKSRLATLNVRINVREKEINGLKNEVARLEKERQEMVVPNAPDAICPEFIKMGYGSCSRATKHR